MVGSGSDRRIPMAHQDVTFDPVGAACGVRILAWKGEVILMLKVRDVMAREVVTVRPETALKDVAGLLVDQRISGVPVLDADRAVVGVVSEADLLIKEQGADSIRHRRMARLFGDSSESRRQLAKLTAVTAGEAMTAPAVTIGPDRRVAEAAALMIARKVNRLPVVDAGRLVGIVTRADLVRAFVRSDAELAETIRDEVLLHILWLDPTLFRRRRDRRRGNDHGPRPAALDRRDDRADGEHAAGHHRCPRRCDLGGGRQPVQAIGARSRLPIRPSLTEARGRMARDWMTFASRPAGRLR